MVPSEPIFVSEVVTSAITDLSHAHLIGDVRAMDAAMVRLDRVRNDSTIDEYSRVIAESAFDASALEIAASNLSRETPGRLAKLMAKVGRGSSSQADPLLDYCALAWNQEDPELYARIASAFDEIPPSQRIGVNLDLSANAPRETVYRNAVLMAAVNVIWSFQDENPRLIEGVLQRMFAIDPGNCYALLHRALWWRAQGRPADAIRDLDRFLATSPEVEKSLVRLLREETVRQMNASKIRN